MDRFTRQHATVREMEEGPWGCVVRMPTRRSSRCRRARTAAGVWMRAGCALSYCAHFRRSLLTQCAERTRHLVIIANSDGRRMGRYKDYREPKRRGYDEDYAAQDRAAE